MYIAEDTVPGIPTTSQVVRIFYNANMFADAGCEVPTTWAEYMEVCKKLQEKGYTPFGFPNASKGDLSWLWFCNSLSNQMNHAALADVDVSGNGYAELPEIVKAFKEGKLDFTSAPLKQTYELMVEFSQYWTSDYNGLDQATAYLAELLQEAGGRVAVPSQDPAFSVIRDPSRAERGEPPYVSNWSERHAAFIAGLGTFGLSKHLITEKGVCGRFSSVITDLPLTVTERPYTDPYEYCTFCGACRKRCPANAIGPTEKHNPTCSDYCKTTRERFSPRYGCGKCQLSVPCETRRPKKAQGK